MTESRADAFAAHSAPEEQSRRPAIESGVMHERHCDHDLQFDYLDRFLRASTAQLTSGLSPYAIGAAWFDWSLHTMRSPGRQLDLWQAFLVNESKLARFMMACLLGRETDRPFHPRAGDHRFDAPGWSDMPSCFLLQRYLAMEDWWQLATSEIRGMAPKHADRVAFMTSQMLDVIAPTNNGITNPVILHKTISEGGRNIVRGMANLLDDITREMAQEPPRSVHKFRVGRDLAITPGTVVFRNHMFELIQYAPTTPEVRTEPLLIVPAWIMKYYILDLSPKTSLVRHLVDRGHTVFMISWINPGPDMRETSLDDYRQAVMQAIDAITGSLSVEKLHLAGYCLGGTIAAIASATMARDGDDRLQSLTLLAAQTDFSEAGELMLFVDHSQIAFLEDMMWAQGVLKGRQMSGAFRMLRSNELVWSRFIQEYVLGERPEISDIQAWSEDLTRMPYRMHSQYLRGLFLENRLTAGRFAVDGRVIALKDVEAPMFIVGTESDHIAPWRSVYKTHLFTDNELTFALTSGGHNTGIVSEPGHRRRHYRLGLRKPLERYHDPDTWSETAKVVEGSWWLAWFDWLSEKSSPGLMPARSDRRATGQLQPLCAAPGEFVAQR
ncbi:MAG: alpha/beta fold hydrolase [Hyphomicrobiaceae bacterium]